MWLVTLYGGLVNFFEFELPFGWPFRDIYTVGLRVNYEWLFADLTPDIDGIVLTVVETQIRATDTPLMLRLVGILDEKCRKYGKMLIVRTFTWHPDELEGVLGCIRQLPEDVVVMSKCVPQDWQMWPIHNGAIGAVGDRDQIVILTKGAHFNQDRNRVTPFDITSDLFDSLVRLRTDSIDLYLLHRDDPTVPVGPIVEVLNEHKEAGRICAIGGSNWTR